MSRKRLARDRKPALVRATPLGSATIAMVVTNVGGGDASRARRTAWTRAALSSLIGVLFAAISLACRSSGCGSSAPIPPSSLPARYLALAGASYPLLGFGVGLVFALQGAGHVLRSFLVGSLCLAFIAAGTGIVIGAAGRLTQSGLFVIVALASLLFAAGMVAASCSLLRQIPPHF